MYLKINKSGHKEIVPIPYAIVVTDGGNFLKVSLKFSKEIFN